MSKKKEKLKDSYLSSKDQRSLEDRRADYFEKAIGTPSEKMASLTRFLNRQNCAKLIAQNEMMSITKGVLGDIVEAGVYFGGGLMGWALLSASLEPYNYQCQVLGFDTFEGAVGLSDVDFQNENLNRKEGEYYAPCYEDLQECINIFDGDRPLSHMPKVKLIKGDIRETASDYVSKHPEQNIRILHIGMNIYEPTLKALEAFLPLIPKGGIVAIDGLNYASTGCMQALKEVMKDKALPKMRVVEYYPNFTYFVVE